MSRCGEIRILVAGAVLGALEPDEAEAVRNHLAGCPRCRREHADLAVLPRMLDAVESPEVAPERPSPALEDAVLDRHARERGTAAPEPRRRRWRARTLVPAAAAGTALVVVAALALAGVFGGGENGGGYELALRPGPGAPAASGSATLRGVEAGMDVRLHARGLPGGGRAVYELWCVRGDGSWVNAGTFHAPDGTASASLTAAVRRGDYQAMIVKRRPPGARAGVRGETVLWARLSRD